MDDVHFIYLFIYNPNRDIFLQILVASLFKKFIFLGVYDDSNYEKMIWYFIFILKFYNLSFLS